MKRILWTPGLACAAVSPKGVVVLEAGHDQLCTTLWETLNSNADLAELIQVLTQAFSTNLKAMPGFAAIIIDGDSLHLATRGHFHISIDTPTGRQMITAGDDVISWEEQRIANVHAWRMTTTPRTDTSPAPHHWAINATLPIDTLCSETWVEQAEATPSEDDKADPKTALTIDLPTLLDEEDTPLNLTVEDGAHDGDTIRSDQQKAILAHMSEPGAFVPASSGLASSAPGASALGPQATTSPSSVPTVFALLCANGHANPTHVNTCLVCSASLGTATTQVPQPVLGTVYFSTGEILTLDRDVIVGRRPAYRPQPGRPQPHIVPVPSPNQEISRTHCEISVNGWDVRVHDLGSNNGTFLLRPGQAPLRVTPGTPSILRAGDVLDIGDGVTIRMGAQ